MTVSLHVAPHPEALIGLLVDQLSDPPQDPFAAELIAVPTRGIERWITQRIALELADRGVGDGIAANIEFPSPSRLVSEVLQTVPDLAAAASAWEGPGLVGHILAAVDDHVDEPWLRLVQRHLEGPEPGVNRYAAAVKIARLYTGYARRRPQLIRAWAGGDDSAPDGRPVAPADGWQPRLWRLVRERIGVPALAELLPAGLDPVRRGEIPLDLPDRLAVYGLTAADPLDLEVLAAVGEQREVGLYVLHPSPALWEAVSATQSRHPERSADPSAGLVQHGLLASWGRDSRELQLVLAGHGLTAPAVAAVDEEPATLLARLQHDIRTNRPLAFGADLAARVAAGSDRSVQIHVTHGARRQAEVTRDAILHVLAADPTLEPRDVVIMTPDLATFAPLLEAAFPAGGDDPGLPDLRLRIADRSPAAVNPLVRFAAAVLDLVDSRLEAGVVRELVTRPVVQQRFGFDHDTATAIVAVIDDGHISWGLDGGDRAAWHAGEGAERTWRRGLDRALAGVFYHDSPVRVVAGTAPLHGVEGQEAVPVGLLAALIDRITAARELLTTPVSMSRWARAVADAVGLLAAPAWGEEWQLSQLERLLAETFPVPAEGGPDPVLSVAEVRRAVAAWADARPSPLHFRTGDVTLCTLVPMRSVPFRVVCLLGMDDERFPRSSRSDGDDLLLTHEVVGDYDRSAQDRQLLLDAVMAAGDHLIVTYAGRDQLTNANLPPAVPIAELQDAVTAMVGDDGLARLVTTHPLQSFSEANFIPGALGVKSAFGFDPMQLAGAAAVARRPLGPVAAPGWPEPETIDTIDLKDLVAFLEHPARRFMQIRMGFSVPERRELPDDTLPADLSPLDAWGLRERLLAGLADGHDPGDVVKREMAADALPPGALCLDDVEQAAVDATNLWNAAVARGYRRDGMQPYRGSLDVGGITVTGTVSADPEQGHLFTVTASRLKAKQRLRAYASLVFLAALEPAVEWRAFVLGRRPKGDGHVALRIGPMRPPGARQRLADLIDLYLEGHRAPLPLPCESAYTWQRNLGKGRDAAVWETREFWERDRFRPEAGDPAHALLLGDVTTFAALLDSGFVDLCARLWAPILELSGETKV